MPHAEFQRPDLIKLFEQRLQSCTEKELCDLAFKLFDGLSLHVVRSGKKSRFVGHYHGISEEILSSFCLGDDQKKNGLEHIQEIRERILQEKKT